jgi:hypothetical protein
MGKVTAALCVQLRVCLVASFKIKKFINNKFCTALLYHRVNELKLLKSLLKRAQTTFAPELDTAAGGTVRRGR